MQQAYPGQQPSGAFNGNNGPPEAGSTSSPASTAATGTAVGASKTNQLNNGGRFDFDDGGTYCGGWEDGKAHGHGVCTGPKGQGAYSGSWHFGFEVSGVYTWPSGSAYEGQWQNGKRHGLGVESRGRWIYRGEWTQGFKGRYGVRQSTTSTAKYEGTWANGLQDGYGSETYADGGTYQGQWLRGMRHGYGVRASAPFGLASHCRPKQSLRASMTSLRSNEAFNSSAGAGSSSSAANAAATAAAERDRRVDDARGGFVLKAKSDEPPQRRRSLVEKSLKKSILNGLKMRKQRSTGDLDQRVTSAGSLRSNASSASWVSMDSSQEVTNGGSLHTDSNASFVVEDEHMDANVTETYMGEWKNDKRSGFGISERSDGLRYEGEWFNNKKYGYGVTILRDGTREEGKYKNNVLITSQKKKHIFLIRSAKFRERIDAAINAGQRASKIALQKADIAISRMATSRGKAEQADACSYQAREDFEVARLTAKQFDPDFNLPSLEKLHLRDLSRYRISLDDKFSSSQQTTQSSASSTNEHNVFRNNKIPNSIPPLPPRSSQSNYVPPLHHRPSMQFQSQSSASQQYVATTIGSATKNTNPTINNPSTPSKSQQLPNSIPHRYPSNRYQPAVDESEYNRPYPYSRNVPPSPLTEDEQRFKQPNRIPNSNYLHSGNNDNDDFNFNNNNNNNNCSNNNSNNPTGNAIPSRLQQSNYAHQQQQQQIYHNSYYGSSSGSDPSHFPNNELSQQHHYPTQRPPTLNYSPKSQQQQYNQFRHNSSQFTRIDSPSPHRNPLHPQLSDSMRQHSFDIPTQSTNDKLHHQMNKMNSIDSGSLYQQQQHYNRNAALRRNSRLVSGDSPYASKQVMSDHFGHYERPPSRDGSEDRYTRAASRLSGGSRQPSVDRTKPVSSFDNTPLLPTGGGGPDRIGSRSGSVVRGTTPTVTGNGSVIGGTGLGGPMFINNNTRNPTSNQIQNSSQLPFEDIILRKRSLGQDIVPSPIGQPKRTESLYVSSGGSGPVTGGTGRKESQKKDTHILSSLQRKKSLPDFQGLPAASTPMSREQVSVLSSARREEMRRLQEENERLHANPFLYLVSPHVKDWFSRQQLLMVILFINISLAIIFFKLLTS